MASTVGGGLSWMPRDQLEAAYMASQNEVMRLRAREVGMGREAGAWGGGAREREVQRDIFRSRTPTASHRSHATSRRSRLGEPSRRREGEGESGGPGLESGAGS